jgi:hypothetical protein
VQAVRWYWGDARGRKRQRVHEVHQLADSRTRKYSSRYRSAAGPQTLQQRGHREGRLRRH